MFCRNFAKFTGKHLRQSLFFNKVAVNRLRCFPVILRYLLNHIFSENRTTASRTLIFYNGCFWNNYITTSIFPLIGFPRASFNQAHNTNHRVYVMLYRSFNKQIICNLILVALTLMAFLVQYIQIKTKNQKLKL